MARSEPQDPRFSFDAALRRARERRDDAVESSADLVAVLRREIASRSGDDAGVVNVYSARRAGDGQFMLICWTLGSWILFAVGRDGASVVDRLAGMELVRTERAKADPDGSFVLTFQTHTLGLTVARWSGPEFWEDAAGQSDEAILYIPGLEGHE